ACKVELPDRWRVWVKSLNPSQRSYWDGLQSCCLGDYQSAVPAFERALPTLRLKPSTWPLALNAANRLVAARKSLGQRPETTEAYRLLANLLAQPESLSAATGWSAFEVWRRRAEAWFWVARSEALQGDYQNGKISVHQGLTQVKTAQTSLPNLSDKQQQIYDDLRADGYHILASRIAYEEKDYVGALTLNRLAQDISGLSLEWRQRLQWAEAWYLYVSNDRNRAVQIWENLLASSKDEAKPRLHYWIGRALLELGKKTQAEDVFQSLTHDYPLSFYTVVALPKLDKNFIFKDRWVDVSRLEKRLQTRQNLVLEAFQKDLEAERRLVRLELCLAAGLDQWLEPLGAELYRYVSTRPLLLKEVQTSLYVSRLLHMSGAHLLAISLTTQLSNQLDNFWDIYPEQILVYFPQPFLDVYQRTAASNYIDLEIPLAISRQESSFQSNAESPAEALGLMQLMTATALKQAERLGVPLRNPAEELKQPSINIGLGTAYLSELGRRYQSQWPQAFAAYNAGEYAVDAWLKRRASLDLVLWTEALSFGETSSYVKNVWRNWEVYRWLRQPNSH
ncbi:MAG: transglycosylase SLT domain-containing protein, partial [Proteobacteria bacterium]|nr:transglycosylase SLT domain-containing protein [Pseudomonadota bacterium]